MKKRFCADLTEYFVMKDGKVGEFGTFDDLMKEKGYFYALFTVTGTSRR